ncbi:MAG: GTPase Era [Candidatus Omnitrophica bacterium]|nr:GTPase Era [Candidatus Omnitrophota bacterium]
MHRSGFIAIAGQPNVGKSTILNGLLSEKLAIISPRPETTRDTIRGILTTEEFQAIFVDTPGIHKPHDLLGKLMLSRAQSSLLESDVILMVTEKRLAFNQEDDLILDRLPEPGSGKKVILAINKADKVREKRTLLPLLERAQKEYPFDEVIPMCALDRSDIDRLMDILEKYLPEGPRLYPEDHLTDRRNEFFIQEIIREKALQCTFQEVPHSVAVVVDEISEDLDNDLLRILATIYVERRSQKGILIGKGAAKIKKIGKLSTPEISSLLGRDIYLDLWVKVFERWKKDPRGLAEMGYTDS